MIAESSQFDRMEQQNQDSISEINQDRHTSYGTKTKATKAKNSQSFAPRKQSTNRVGWDLECDKN